MSPFANVFAFRQEFGNDTDIIQPSKKHPSVYIECVLVLNASTRIVSLNAYNPAKRILLFLNSLFTVLILLLTS